VTSVFGWEPHQSWRRGEQKRFVRPDGTECVFDSVHESGGWKRFNNEDERTRSLQDQFVSWMNRLRSKGEPLRRLLKRGWEVEFNCFATTSECLVLPVALLEELARLGIGMDFTFSAGEVT